MKRVKGSISTNKVGSKCEFDFEVDDDTTPEQIEELAKEAAFDYVDWSFEVEDIGGEV